MGKLIKICLLSLLMGCSGLEKGEQETLRQSNAKASVVLRNHDELHYVIETPKQKPKPIYPWEIE
jgi:hypothetical protein